MPRVGFEPIIPVFEWAMTVHTLDCAATVTGSSVYIHNDKYKNLIHGFISQYNKQQYTTQPEEHARKRCQNF
jgi:hypothetical protein